MQERLLFILVIVVILLHSSSSSRASVNRCIWPHIEELQVLPEPPSLQKPKPRIFTLIISVFVMILGGRA